MRTLNQILQTEKPEVVKAAMAKAEKMMSKVTNLPAVSSENNAMLSMIERVCLDQNADISKLEKMLDMQERILNRNAEQAFASDFAAMQSELPRIARNGKIEIKDKTSGRVTQSTPFAKLEDINDAIKPIMQKYGFGVSFSIDQSNALITVTAKLLHRLGHSEKTSISLPLDNSGSKNSVQANGSSVSYGKRYAICALLNISTGDDVDGNIPQAEPQQKTVGEDEIKHLLNAAVVAGVDEAYICKKAQVNNLSEILLVRYASAMNHLKRLAEKGGAK